MDQATADEIVKRHIETPVQWAVGTTLGHLSIYNNIDLPELREACVRYIRVIDDTLLAMEVDKLLEGL